ncbi:MAG: norR 25 [Firmicutes bacterium]|nr:norR 25 [Bacillota bacterium]
MKQAKQIDTHLLAHQLHVILPFIGRISGGFATITDQNGKRLKTVDSHGQEIENLQGVFYDLALDALEKQTPVFGSSGIVPNAEAWAIPIGEYVISGCNIERVEREQNLWNSLSKALPLIARVVGGEAVLFDHEGCRLESINPLGQCNKMYIGKCSHAAKRAMEIQEPIIDKSISVPGATAVRIPITENYGLGFNNEQTVLEKNKLINEVKKFQYAKYNFEDITGSSPSIVHAKELASRVALSLSSVLIYGETGTGKEVFAQAIHNASRRRECPFIAINCGAMPASLIEGNLFGYVDGAFTGAKKGGNAGLFEDANHGTLFLDEISEMEWELQAKLLRVLQEHEVVRIGSTKPTRIDVRVIAATNKHLRQLVKDKQFREDLFYRLNVIELNLPPLRERQDDIEDLAGLFIKKFNNIFGKMVVSISPKVVKLFREYAWPGNVRELQNCIESSLNLIPVNEQVLESQHLPAQFTNRNVNDYANTGNKELDSYNLATVLRDTEKNLLINILKAENNNRTQAAKKLGISTTTLWRKMCEYQLLQK